MLRSSPLFQTALSDKPLNRPSPDPADPLNFSNSRKITILALMALYAFVTNVSSSIISSALPTLVTAFATFHERGPPTGIVPFSKLTHLIAVNNLFLGAANIWWVPLGNSKYRSMKSTMHMLMMR